MASAYVVRAGYGVAFAYCGADIAYHARNAQEGDVARTVAHMSTFHGLASIAMPSLIIHTAVHQSKNVFRRMGRFVRWGPVFSGLILIPILPFTVDEPIEHAVDWAFEKWWPAPKLAHSKEE